MQIIPIYEEFQNLIYIFNFFLAFMNLITPNIKPIINKEITTITYCIEIHELSISHFKLLFTIVLQKLSHPILLDPRTISLDLLAQNESRVEYTSGIPPCVITGSALP